MDLAGVVAAGDQGLQIGDNEAQRVQDDPGDNNTLQPGVASSTARLGFSGNHADQKSDGGAVTATIG